MLKSVLMAASRLPSSQIPTPLKPQYSFAPLNTVLGNALNPVQLRGDEFNENCRFRPEPESDALQRAADRERRHVARPRRGALAACRVGIGDVAALDLGIDAAHDAFGHRMRGRQHSEI